MAEPCYAEPVMTPKSLTRLAVLAGACVAAALPLAVVSAATMRDPVRPDLATLAAGTYTGDVISDSKGSSRDGVTVTVRRITRNTVAVTTDYPRLPSVVVALERDMGMILARRGDTVFNLDESKVPPALTITFNGEATWQGVKRSSSSPP
jgi:hypothetical protein